MNKIIVSFLLLSLIAGCSRAPGCNDSETKDLVIDIANDTAIEKMGSFSSNFSYEVRSVRTTHTNKQTGTHQCMADLAVTAKTKGRTNLLPIEYTVELTDDGSEFYVTVYGL